MFETTLRTNAPTEKRFAGGLTPVHRKGGICHLICLLSAIVSEGNKDTASNFPSEKARGRKEAECADIQCATWLSVQYASGSGYPLCRKLVYITLRYAVGLFINLSQQLFLDV